MAITNSPNSAISTTMMEVRDSANIVGTVKCYYGQTCKGVRGLKMHQKLCRNIEDLPNDGLKPIAPNFDTNGSLDETLASDHMDCISFDNLDTADTKPSGYLPMTNDQLAMANDIFKSTVILILMQYLSY